jgi:hypothetical protein
MLHAGRKSMAAALTGTAHPSHRLVVLLAILTKKKKGRGEKTLRHHKNMLIRCYALKHAANGNIFTISCCTIFTSLLPRGRLSSCYGWNPVTDSTFFAGDVGAWCGRCTLHDTTSAPYAVITWGQYFVVCFAGWIGKDGVVALLPGDTLHPAQWRKNGMPRWPESVAAMVSLMS